MSRTDDSTKYSLVVEEVIWRTFGTKGVSTKYSDEGITFQMISSTLGRSTKDTCLMNPIRSENFKNESSLNRFTENFMKIF